MLTSMRDSIENLGEECYNRVTSVNDLNDEEISRLEKELEANIEDFRKKFDRQARQLLDDVKAKKPSKETPIDDPAYKNYMSLLQETNAAVNKTTTWFTSIFNKIKGLLSSIIEKMKKKFVDIGRDIKEEFKRLIHHPIQHEEVSE